MGLWQKLFGKKQPPELRETTLFAFLAKAETGMGAAYFGRGDMIVFEASQEQIEGLIRERMGLASARVVVVEPREWDAPPLGSVSQSELQMKFPQVISRVVQYLHERGRSDLTAERLVSSGIVLPNPVSGRVFFVYRVESSG